MNEAAQLVITERGLGQMALGKWITSSLRTWFRRQRGKSKSETNNRQQFLGLYCPVTLSSDGVIFALHLLREGLAEETCEFGKGCRKRDQIHHLHTVP